MGQKVSPLGFRVGITEPWRSRWYARKRDFGDCLVQDCRIREHVKKYYAGAGIPQVEIERRGDAIRVIVHTARPGVLIGKKGAKVDKLRDELRELTGVSELDLKIKEVPRPELNAQLVAEGVAEALERRQGFRRVLKRAVQTAMQAGALGCRVHIAGRLGGAEMSRREKQMQGRIPLQTLRAQVDYGFAVAKTTYGTIGVKCWIYLGEYPETERERSGGHGADAAAG